MSNAIKSHYTDNSIKSSKDIKSAGNKIKEAGENTVKDKDDKRPSIERGPERGAEGIGVAAGTVAYAGARFSYQMATVRTRQTIRQAQTYHTTLKAQYKAKKSISRERVKAARRDYQQIKSQAKAKEKQSGIKSSERSQNAANKAEIKNSKYEYKATKEAQKQQIKAAKKELRSNWFELFKMKAESDIKKAIYTVLAIVMAIVVAGSVIAIMFSPSGVLMSDADEENGIYSLNSAMDAINQEFSDKIKAIEAANTFDEEIINNYGCQYEIANWSDIVAVWSVKNTSEENASFAIDEDAFQNLRTVAWDMTNITGSLDTRTETDTTAVPTTTANAQRPQPVTKTVTTLTITVTYASSDTMKEQYNFNDEQKASVLELFSDGDYLSLFEKVNAVGVPGGDYSNDFAAKSENGKFIYPTSYHTISGGYPNYSSGKYHGALDFPCPNGTSVYAVGDGVVEYAGWHYSYGNYVKINHGNGITTILAHNSQLVVSAGQTVTQGQLVAYSGATGNVTGPHVHFEVRVNNQRVNPKDYL